MSVLTSEAVVLRTWPVREADLIVSFFTRDYGRMQGVAKAALKSRKRFGGALEPMTLARAWFAERPRQELVRLDQLEILRSPLSAPVDHTRMAVLSFFAEVIDEALPERDPQETVFRLLVSVLEQTTREQTVDAAHLFFALDDAPDGSAAGHRPLYRLRRGTARGGGLVQQLCRRVVLRAAPQWNGERAFGRFLATGAADVARARIGLCRRVVATQARTGFAPLHLADAGAAFGAEAEERGGAGEAGRGEVNRVIASTRESAITLDRI